MGQKGFALTDLRPIGRIEVINKRVEAKSERGFIAAGTAITVIAVESGVPIVREAAPPMNEPTSAADDGQPLARSWGATIGFLVVGAAVAAGGVALIVKIGDTGSTIIGAIAILSGVALAIAAYGGAMKAPCTGCGASLGFGSKDSDRQLCLECGAVTQTEKGRTRPLDATFQSEKPDFTAPFRDEVLLPPLCATCGAAATRIVDYDWKTNNWAAKAAIVGGALLSGSIAVTFGGKQTAHVDVPCCDAHEGGLLVKDEDKAELTLAVSSYRFFREYLKLNKLRPQGFRG